MPSMTNMSASVQTRRRVLFKAKAVTLSFAGRADAARLLKSPLALYQNCDILSRE